jgi:hypothetical protein
MLSIMKRQCKAIESDEHIRKIGPSVGTGSKQILGVDSLRIARLSKFMTLDPSLPKALPAITITDQCQYKDEDQESTPSDGVNPKGKSVTLFHGTIICR